MSTDPAKTPQAYEHSNRPTATGSPRARLAGALDRLQHLQNITEALAAALTVGAVADAIIKHGVSALGARAGSIGLLTEEGNALEVVGSTGYDDDEAASRDTVDMTAPSAWADAANSKEIVFVASPEEMAARYPIPSGLYTDFGDKAHAAIPLVDQGRCLGVMGVGFSEPRVFAPDDIDFIRTIARQGALALQRARLYGVEREARELAQKSQHSAALLAEASRLLASSLDYEETLDAIAQSVVPGMADWCIIDLASADGTIERLTVAHVDPARVAWARELQQRYPPRRNENQGVANVLATGRPVLYSQITDDMIRPAARDDEEYGLLRELGLGSVMLVPLAARGRTLGVITFVTTAESGRIYTKEDLRLAEDLAQRAAVAADNARLYREIQGAMELHRSAEERLATLTEASGALLSSLKLDQLLPVILNLAERLFAADAYALWRADPETNAWQPVCHSSLSKQFTDAMVPWRQTTPSILEHPVIVEDIESDSTLATRYQAHKNEGIRSLLVLPLTIRSQSSGTLAFYYRHPHSFSATDIRVACAIANLASAAIGTTELYQEQDQMRAESQAAVLRQRTFVRDVLASVTEGKLFLCNSTKDLPRCKKPIGLSIHLAKDTSLRKLRHHADNVAEHLGFAPERRLDLITAVSEAAMNAVTHAGGGKGRVCSDTSDTVQVWIEDQGEGIDVAQLPRATLEKGFTTAGSLGHGMKIMLSSIDRLWLLTGSTGTIVVLEQDRVSPRQAWG